ncbi:hypothetical protein Franean1_6738 [Parafrankia sp. EAN1pec]|uniref:hypothetical protein n=1 Tax=Parafrankia sp. (strain EAN1pec) TaxID=298653 RepID=UPI00015DA10B|nr:hypothetical protein Franean1_6738 [Frankia sp. EAN1pec]
MNRPPAHQRADRETPAGEQTPPPQQPAEDREPLGAVRAVELHTGDLYRHTSPPLGAEDDAEPIPGLWIVTKTFDLAALDRDDEDTLLHAHPAGRPGNASAQCDTSPEDEVDLLARLLDETTDCTEKSYALTRLYRLPEATVRVQVRRTFLGPHPAATVDLLTSDGWSTLIDDPASPWRPTPHGLHEVRAVLDPLATGLLLRAHRALTASWPAPHPQPRPARTSATDEATPSPTPASPQVGDERRR